MNTTNPLIVMKALGIFLGVMILASCSVEKHPADEQLKAFLGTLAPQILDIQSVAVKYSSTPMRVMLGNTLPAGSLEATCKVVAKLKEDLYVTADQADPKNPQAKLIMNLDARSNQIRDRSASLTPALINTSDRLDLDSAHNGLLNYPAKRIIFLKSHAGDTFQFNVSILAIPQYDSWKLQFIDSDLPTVAAAFGQSRDAMVVSSVFPVPVLVSGSRDATDYLDGYRAIVETCESREQSIIEKYKKLLREGSDRCLALLKQNPTLHGVLTGYPHNIRADFSFIGNNEGTMTLSMEPGSRANPAVFDVCIVTPASAHSDTDIVSGARGPFVLVLKQPGCLRDLSRGSIFGELMQGGNNGYLRIDGNHLVGTTAGTIAYDVSFTLP